jgi:hypothetical protein
MTRRAHLAILLFLLAWGSARAGGAYLVNGAGEPLVWDVSRPLVFNIDQGGLGQLTPEVAQDLAVASFAVWGQVPDSALSFVQGDPLPCDVRPEIYSPEFTGCGPDGLPIFGDPNDPYSPVIFDEDGSLIDLLFGPEARVAIIGAATVSGGSFLPPRITDAEAILNGLFHDGIDSQANPELVERDAFQAVFVHEIGHWINLDHSQLNVGYWSDGDAANDRFLPTMFPASGDDDTQLLVLNPDDVATVVDLYPAPGLSGLSGTVSGRVFLPDGATLFQGANLILRSTEEPDLHVHSAVSGALYFPVPPSGVSQAEFGGPPPPALKGLFRFGGIPAGSYTLEVEEIHPGFLFGSSVGPFPAPVFVPGPHEYWSGAVESADPAVDDPAAYAVLEVLADLLQPGIDIVLNELPPPALLWAVDDELFDPNDPQSPTAIIELDMGSGEILRRYPAPERNLGFCEGLAFAPPRGTLFFTQCGGLSSRLIYELDPADGTVLNSFSWPAGAQSIEGLAFLNGPDQPAGGVLYALDGDADVILGLSPEDGSPKGSDLTVSANLFAALGGAGDDLFVSVKPNFILHLRPMDPEPLANYFPKPGLTQFDPILQSGLDEQLQGIGFDGQALYTCSFSPVDPEPGVAGNDLEYRLWRLNPFPATDRSEPSHRLDALDVRLDPTTLVPGGFSAAAVALRGDLDGSLRVDGFDLAALARVFPTAQVDASSRAADLDRDEDVDGDDLTIFAAFFGRSQLPVMP